ncbi:hypothetical protein P3T21_005530 [Paraburkholderia sp. GAS334]
MIHDRVTRFFSVSLIGALRNIRSILAISCSIRQRNFGNGSPRHNNSGASSIVRKSICSASAQYTGREPQKRETLVCPVPDGHSEKSQRSPTLETSL